MEKTNSKQDLFNYHTNEIKQLQYGFNQMVKLGGNITPAMKEYLHDIKYHKEQLKKLLNLKD